jgi:hypothetical protein
MPSEPVAHPWRDYHLDIAFEDGVLRVNVEGAPDHALREHVAEVAEAATRCGLSVVLTGIAPAPA